MKHNYRNEARSALVRAKTELECQMQDRFKYAALELRMASLVMQIEILELKCKEE